MKLKNTAVDYKSNLKLQVSNSEFHQDYFGVVWTEDSVFLKIIFWRIIDFFPESAWQKYQYSADICCKSKILISTFSTNGHWL